jgi:hypothetical protein
MIVEAVKFAAEFTYPLQAFNSFNYVLAPLIDKMSDTDLHRVLKIFFENLNKLGIKLYVGLDVGISPFAETYGPVYVLGESAAKYKDFKDQAKRVEAAITKLSREGQSENIFFVFKLWKKTSEVENLQHCYVANMLALKVDDASFIGDFKFDTNWKRWGGVVRMGALQEIVINLPKLAIKAKAEAEFFNQLKLLVDDCIEYELHMFELSLANFFRRHHTTFESAVKGRWDFVSIYDCVNCISISGLRDASEYLSKKDITKKIWDFLNKQVNSKNLPIRAILRENADPIIANRFLTLNSRSGLTNKSMPDKSSAPAIKNLNELTKKGLTYAYID